MSKLRILTIHLEKRLNYSSCLIIMESRFQIFNDRTFPELYTFVGTDTEISAKIVANSPDSHHVVKRDYSGNKRL